MTIAMMNTDTNTPRAPGHRNEEVLDEIDRVPTLILYPAHPGKGGPEWAFGDYVVGGPLSHHHLSSPHAAVALARFHMSIKLRWSVARFSETCETKRQRRRTQSTSGSRRVRLE